MINFDDFSKNDIKKYSSEALCNIIVTSRYFNLDMAIQAACLGELGFRQKNGDTFDFEGYINKELSELPVIDQSAFDIVKNFKNIKNNL